MNGRQTTKLKVKLYDAMDQDEEEAEARNPMFGVLGLFFFLVIFLGVCMSRLDLIKPISVRTTHLSSRAMSKYFKIR